MNRGDEATTLAWQSEPGARRYARNPGIPAPAEHAAWFVRALADPDCLLSAREIRHRPVGAPSTTAGREDTTRDWLPLSGPVVLGLTAGASTPNNIVGQVIERLERYTR